MEFFGWNSINMQIHIYLSDWFVNFVSFGYEQFCFAPVGAFYIRCMLLMSWKILTFVYEWITKVYIN